MDAQRWRRARALFEALADRPPASWEAELAARCADDAAVRAEALALLRADAPHSPTALGARAPDLLAAVVEAQDAARSGELAGTRVGPFRLLRELGRGGMGRVWLGERADGQFAQQVAVKLVRGGWDADELAVRFKAERQILAGLAHPHIAHLVDGGVTPDGKPWLALEYVDGVDLRDFCDARHLDLPARLRLFLTVCDAVAYAHARLVVHRDLKPSNILVDTNGQVKLLDFGIAKLIDADSQASATQAFTPEYAAPEQLRGDVVTTSVDVYALGLLLYELLAGCRPYRVENSTPAAYERAILDQEPTRPSAAVLHIDDAPGSGAAPRPLAPLALARQLRGDLDAIVLKALRKEPAQRYAAVADLAADIQAHLDHRPVLAHRGGWRYRAARFARRHALALALTVAVFAALAGGLLVALSLMEDARRQRDRAVVEAAKSEAALKFMGELFESADPEQARGTPLSARDLLARGTARIRGALQEQPAARAVLLAAMGKAHRGLGLYEESLPLLAEAAALADNDGDGALRHGVRLQQAASLHALTRFRDELALLDQAAPDAAGGSDAALRQADLALQRGLALQALNDLDPAAAAYARAHALRAALFGEGDWRTQEITLRQISLLSLRGRHADALPLARDTLAAVRRTGGERDPHRIEALDALAMVQTNLGRLDEAEALRREELALVGEVFGAEHPRHTSAENDLASVLYAQQRVAEAAPLFEHVLAQRRAKFGPDHAGVATVANNLAWCELGLGHADKARDLAAEALRIRRKVYGLQHHTTAASLRALGASELSLGDLDAAGEHLHQAVAAYDASLGPGSSTVLGSLNDVVRWEVLSRHAPADCATARRAAKLFHLKDGDDSLGAAYQRVMLEACWLAAGASHGSLAALRVAAAGVHAKAEPGHSSLPKVDQLVAWLERAR